MEFKSSTGMPLESAFSVAGTSGKKCRRVRTSVSFSLVHPNVVEVDNLARGRHNVVLGDA